MKSYWQFILSAVLGMSVVAVGCSGSPTPTSNHADQLPASTETTTSAVEASQSTTDQIKFKQADGSEKYSLKLKPDGAKLVDGADQELARLTVDETQKVKIKDAGDQVLGYVVSQDGYWKLENPAQTQELYILRRQEDGDFKLEEGTTDALVYRIKVRDYGYEIESPQETSLYKVKVKDGKISLRNARDETVMSTRSSLVPAAMVCFGFDVLTPAQQSALAYAVNQAGGQ
jgi:hypothetical protein